MKDFKETNIYLVKELSSSNSSVFIADNLQTVVDNFPTAHSIERIYGYVKILEPKK